MTDLLSLPWLEAAILAPLIGSLVVGRVRDPFQAARWGVALTSITFALTMFAGAAAAAGTSPVGQPWDVQARLFNGRPFSLDELTAPLVPVIALLHLLTAAATARTRMRRFSFAWSLATEWIGLATFTCTDRWMLVGLLAAGTIPPLMELRERRRPARVYLVHMGLFVGLLIVGWILTDAGSRDLGPGMLLAAVLIRCGIVPAHCWVTDWFEHSSFGNALLFVAPLTGVYAAARLFLPTAPSWALDVLGVAALISAVYAAAMATVQREARRLFAFLFLSHGSLVLLGLAQDNPLSLTGSLRIWSSVVLSLGGFGLTMRALEARIGRLSLTRYHGLYEHVPGLAVCYLLTGLASVGFPGTLGFVGSDMLVEGTVEGNPWVGIGAVAAAALNGIAVVRAYFLLFTGARHGATIPLRATGRERFAVLTLAALILGLGLVPQPALMARYRAAEQILKERHTRLNPPEVATTGSSAR
ncbi:MAG TPA: proton-conducting transporter membrane subunit [Gemmataceae bacterium]|nr:proton-conducting transporter membrane subunit [Gemmataceae bacterium]